MRHLTLLAAALALAAASCVTATCDAPAGCVYAENVAGTCTCQEWEVVSTYTVPIKFVVVSVRYTAIGNESVLTYGWTNSAPAADSVLGSRLRASIRGTDGREQLASMVNADLGLLPYAPLAPVTGASADVLLAWGDGQGSGSAWGFHSSLDAPGRSADEIGVWVNPTLTVTTDASGALRAGWSWTSVGHCFWPLQLSCEGAHFLSIPVAYLDGTRAPGDFYAAQFLATLTPDERTTILSYHPLYDPPGRDPATLASDPRFTAIGRAEVGPGHATYPSASWLPCQGTLTDADPALHEVEVPTLTPSQRVFLQHAVLSRQATCRTERPGIALATSTPGCDMAADVYVDRAFGTLLFVPTAVGASCTRP
jgi:hypothetical protein